MSKNRHTEAQMIGALKQLAAGRKAEDVAWEVGVRVCYSDEGGRGRFRFAGSAVLNRKPGVGKCRMIPCAKSGGKSMVWTFWPLLTRGDTSPQMLPKRSRHLWSTACLITSGWMPRSTKEDKWSWEELSFLIVLRAVFQFGRGPHSRAVAAYLATESLNFIRVGVTVTSVSVATAQGPLASLRVWRRFIG